MTRLLRLLNSRRTAVWLLLAMLVVLVASTAVPSEFTLTADEWAQLEAERPTMHWIASRFSTPRVVETPLFAALSLFLFASTLACTATRLHRRLKLRRPEFEKDKAFSFALEARSEEEPASLLEAVTRRLRRRRWKVTAAGGRGIEAQKGFAVGFWGSVMFHAGLLICFLAAPVTALTGFLGELVLTEGVDVPLAEAVTGRGGSVQSPRRLPDALVSVHDLWGRYHEGMHKVDFGGTLRFDTWDVPIGVNRPVSYRGYQFGLEKFGNSAGVVIERDGETVFDYLLNLWHPLEGDEFAVEGEGLRMFVLLFPDFYRDGTVLRSRSRELKNPVLLVKFYRGDEALHKGLLLKPGEEGSFEDYRVRFAELRHWIVLIVVREMGLPLIAAGSLVGISGLLVRFLSNERRLEVEAKESEGGTGVTLRGYSRYYPAFLEREVHLLADTLPGTGRGEAS